MPKSIRISDMKQFIYDKLKVFDGKECYLIIPGGSVLTLLDNEAINNMNTSNWKIFFSDERSDKNNLNKNDAQVFIKHLAKEAKVFYIESLLENGAEAYNKVLKINTEEHMKIRQMDLSFLGVGENGHTCSIWPNAESIESEDLFVATHVEDTFPHRMTCTPKFLNERVKEIFFCIPPKNGKPKKNESPDESILRKLTDVPYTIVLPELNP